MLPCVCSVIVQNVVKTKKWHTSRRRVCYWCFYHFLTSSVICYWTDPRLHAIYLFHTMIRKQKKTDTGIPPSFCMTVRRFVLLSPKRYFSSLPSSFFPLTYLYTVSSKRFPWSFLAQSRLMAKTFCKTASLSKRWHPMATVVKISCSLGILKL